MFAFYSPWKCEETRGEMGYYVQVQASLMVWWFVIFRLYLFHDGGTYHIDTNPLIHIANQWTDFYMTGTTVMKKSM